MSKIGNKPIKIIEGCKVEVKDKTTIISGQSGQLEILIPKHISLEIVKENIIIGRKREDKKTKSLHGMFRSVLSNAVQGVIKPWEKRLEISGTGYNVKIVGEDLQLKLGYSHPIVFNKVEGINFKIEGNNKIIIQGVDKQLVGQVADRIRTIKKPDAYKGKGIKYENEWLKMKPGKKAKTETTV